MLHDVSIRTTLTLDDDVAARISAAARASGRPYRAVVNDALRVGLDALGRERRGFVVKPLNMGAWPDRIDMDDIEGLIDRLDTADRR